MTTVLFADRDGGALGALGERTVPALLPLQGVPLLQRALVSLVAAGTRSALLVVGPRAQEIERRFGTGIRWGIALEYVRREAEESVADVLRRLEHRLDGDTFVLRADVGAHGAYAEFLREAEERTEPIVAGVTGGKPAGLWRLRPGALKKKELPREPTAKDWTLEKDHVRLELATGVLLLDSVPAYRRADRAEKPAVSERADVDPRATLDAGVTVAEEAAVFAGTRLKETTILPRTVIPGGVELESAVVSGNLVVDAATGAPSSLSDRLPPRAGDAKEAGLASRLAGTAALVLSIPLWPVALGWSFVANAGHPTRAVTLNGNADGKDVEGNPKRAPFSTFLFETAVPVLRDLPLLLAVVSGRLALSGVTPLPPAEEEALNGWERVRLEAPVGLLSRARIAAPPSASAEVARLVDAFDARRGTAGVVKLALSTLFSPRAWTAPRGWNPDEVPPDEGKR